MKKLYSYLLAGLAVLMVSGLSAQVTGISVTNTAPCPGETVTVSWNAGSDGGTPYTVTVSTVGYGGTDVFGPSLFFANTVDFPVVSGETYYVTIDGPDAAPAELVPMIVTNEAPSIPTSFTINGATASKVCASTAFTIEAVGHTLGTSGTLEWYDDPVTTNIASGNPYNNAGIVGPTTYNVRVEDAVCGNTTGYLTVAVDVYTPPSVAATNVELNGVAYAGAVCPGTYTLTAADGTGGDNPATDTIFYSDAFTTPYAGDQITLGSNASANVYVEFVDGCAVVADVQSGAIAVASKTASTAPASVTTDVAGPVCSGEPVTYTANGATEGTGFTYEYEVNGNGTWVTDADGVVVLNITEATSVAFRLKDDCNTAGTASVASASIGVYTANTDVTAVAHTAGADNEICAGGMVTFTGNGVLGNDPSAFFEYQVTENGGVTTPWAVSATQSHTMAVTMNGTFVEFRTNGTCDGPGTEVASATVNLSANNVAPTMLTPSQATTCGDESVDFTADGTLGGNGAVFQFSDDNTFATTLQSSTSNVYTTTVTADVTIYVRIFGGCNDVSGITVSGMVDHQTANVAPTTLTASAAMVCSGDNVTFTADGTLGFGAMYEFDTDPAFGSVDETNATGTYTVSVTGPVTMYARISGGCNDLSATVVNASSDIYTVNTDVTSVSHDAGAGNAVCSGTDVVFTAVGAAFGNEPNTAYEYRVTEGGVLGAWTANGTTATHTVNVTQTTSVEFRVIGDCSGASAGASSVAVTVLPNSVAPSMVTPSQLTTCGTESVTFTVDGSAQSGAVYEFSFDNFGNTAQSSAANTFVVNVSQDTTVYARISGGCNDVSATVVMNSVDYQEPSDVSGLVATFTDITDPLNPVTFDPATDILCFDSEVSVKIEGIIIGDGATLGHRINGDPYGPTSLVDTTVIISNIQSQTQIRFAIGGSCNGGAFNPIVNEFINVYDAIPDVTSLTIDKDNFCANDGETVTLTAFTSSPVGTPPYSYEWNTYDANTDTYSVIAGSPNSNIYAVVPDTITAYAVRIFGCNDSSAYVARLVTVKDTSSVEFATIVSSADANGSKVCAGSTVTYNLVGGKKGYDAELFWFDANDNPLGQGNPFTMTVSQDTTVYAMYVGECNTTVASVTKTVEVFEQSDVTLAFEAGNEFCVGSALVLADTLIGNPLGGVYSGTNVSGGVLTVQAGNNVVTYTFDFGGCSFSTTATVVGIDSPVASLVAGSIVNDACSGSNVGEFKVEDVDNVGLTFDLYLGAVLQATETSTPLDSIVTFSNLAAGSYNVVVTNTTGCTSTVNAVISSPAGLSAQIDTANSKLIVCNGETDGKVVIAATGGVAPYMYSFDNGSNFGTSNMLANLDGSETLDILVSDDAGCVFTVATGVSVFANTNVVSLTLENIVEPTCYDALDGRFDAVASGGVGPYMYSLDGVNFQSESRFDGLDVDVYTVTVSNVYGCTQDFISPLLGPDSLTVVQSIVSGDPQNGYEVLFTISGGNGGYEISINGGAFGTTFQLSQDAGDYTYVVRDVNGCTKSGSYKLDGVDGINDINNVVSSVYPNPFNNTLTLVGTDMMNAEVVLTDINGKAIAVEMTASNDKVVIATSDVAKGIYLVKVITANGSTVKRVVKN